MIKKDCIDVSVITNSTKSYILNKHIVLDMGMWSELKKTITDDHALYKRAIQKCCQSLENMNNYLERFNGEHREIIEFFMVLKFYAKILYDIIYHEEQQDRMSYDKLCLEIEKLRLRLAKINFIIIAYLPFNLKTAVALSTRVQPPFLGLRMVIILYKQEVLCRSCLRKE